MAKLLEQTIVVSLDDLIILEELEAYNLARSEEELRNLEDQIRAEGGVRDAIVVWPRGKELVLVDGFGRRRAVMKLDIEEPLMAYQMEFDDIEEAKYWIRINQDSRRNLTDDQQAYFVGMLYNELKNDQKALISYLKAKGRLDLLKGDGETSEVHTAQVLGKVYRINEKTIRRNSHFAKGIETIREKNPTLAEQILHQRVKEDEKIVKVNRALIEKFSNTEPPSQIDTLLDVQEAVDVIKKDDDKPRNKGKELLKLFQRFLTKPSLALKRELFEKIDHYFSSKTRGTKKEMSEMTT